MRDSTYYKNASFKLESKYMKKEKNASNAQANSSWRRIHVNNRKKINNQEERSGNHRRVLKDLFFNRKTNKILLLQKTSTVLG